MIKTVCNTGDKTFDGMKVRLVGISDVIGNIAIIEKVDRSLFYTGYKCHTMPMVCLK